MIRTIVGGALPGAPHDRTITGEASFTRPSREDDYPTA